ncbi:MAG TPA: ATP synthase F1 subunit gamma [Bacteroidales bacterium]|nr:ATP synthase F1 subunit gamma [Bacteroidales bacterium]HPS27948.1 ATP synthase F1 subunit gamma [Bacteroidales bacterium]
MSGLKEVRIRIASVNNTKQITSAMKMVSAAKLRRAQGAILKLRPYANKLSGLLSDLSVSAGLPEDIAYFKKRKVQKVLLVVINSNRGLCGAFNSNVIKAAVSRINGEYIERNNTGNLHILTAGKTASDFFTKRGFNVIANYDSIYDNLTYEKSGELAEKLMELYANSTYDRIELVYNQFKNAVSQILTIEQFLPVEKLGQNGQSSLNKTDYIFEPEKSIILKELVPKSLKIQIYKALLDSWASEQGARMSAMQKATDNAEELIKSLKLSYNKARQAAITKEIIEIVSGVNALKG